MGTAAVKVGQIWADNDVRSKPRTIRVVEIIGEKALVEVVTPAAAAVNKGARTRVALKRFRPIATGYRLVTDVPTP
ncbi:hypothetical protein [Cryobacterium zhongshanensis]|uniref:Uncharacterized protein n=1 Tax=Cryobacterium zhongshanensis TaxID=2928153 RepID=A0AA41UMA8_9MICO|nr:hypothetical protein [Cryobacterium zhongshanensis]MCI4659661.1 hypothetical protein [Cryobacterium zhongshanensis]